MYEFGTLTWRQSGVHRRTLPRPLWREQQLANREIRGGWPAETRDRWNQREFSQLDACKTSCNTQVIWWRVSEVYFYQECGLRSNSALTRGSLQRVWLNCKKYDKNECSRLASRICLHGVWNCGGCCEIEDKKRNTVFRTCNYSDAKAEKSAEAQTALQRSFQWWKSLYDVSMRNDDGGMWCWLRSRYALPKRARPSQSTEFPW